MVFNRELLNKQLDFVEANVQDYLECSISLQPELSEEDKECLLDSCRTLEAIKTLRTYEYDNYNDEHAKVLINEDEVITMFQEDDVCVVKRTVDNKEVSWHQFDNVHEAAALFKKLVNESLCK